MIITFLGVGEAFGQFANTSLLVDGKIVLECGPHSILQLRKLKHDLEEIELVFLRAISMGIMFLVYPHSYSLLVKKIGRKS